MDTWSQLRERLTADDIVPDPADKYELDLVVENLRGGADSLDYGLLIQAGEAARDLAYATRLEAVISALAPGTPLDDLDEAIRAADASGGIRGFMAKRKLRKIVTTDRFGLANDNWQDLIGRGLARVTPLRGASFGEHGIVIEAWPGLDRGAIWKWTQPPGVQSAVRATCQCAGTGDRQRGNNRE